LNELDDTDREWPNAFPGADEWHGQDADKAVALAARYAELDGSELLRALITREFFGRLAVVSSFGSESAAILAMVADIDRSIPVLFLDTGKLFGETLRYRDRLAAGFIAARR